MWLAPDPCGGVGGRGVRLSGWSLPCLAPGLRGLDLGDECRHDLVLGLDAFGGVLDSGDVAGAGWQVEQQVVVISPVHVGQQLAFLLVSSLRRDKAESDSAADRDAWRLDQDDTSLASGYDYVMYGKIFKYDERSTEQVSVYGSFGGLLMALTGSFRHLSKITVGANVYLLLR